MIARPALSQSLNPVYGKNKPKATPRQLSLNIINISSRTLERGQGFIWG